MTPTAARARPLPPRAAKKWTAVTVAENTFTRSGYSFAGWNTQADGSGEDYAAGDAFQLTGQDAVLYAQWSYNGGRQHRHDPGTPLRPARAMAAGSARTAGCG